MHTVYTHIHRIHPKAWNQFSSSECIYKLENPLAFFRKRNPRSNKSFRQRVGKPQTSYAYNRRPCTEKEVFGRRVPLAKQDPPPWHPWPPYPSCFNKPFTKPLLLAAGVSLVGRSRCGKKEAEKGGLFSPVKRAKHDARMERTANATMRIIVDDRVQGRRKWHRCLLLPRWDTLPLLTCHGRFVITGRKQRGDSQLGRAILILVRVFWRFLEFRGDCLIVRNFAAHQLSSSVIGLGRNSRSVDTY